VGIDGTIIDWDVMTLTILEPNNLPTADAGDNISISSELVDSIVLQGSGTDADGDSLVCLWTTGTISFPEEPAGPNGECLLDLSTISIDIGTHSFFLEVSDGLDSSNVDEMILDIENSAPHTAPGGAGTYEVNTDVTLFGDVSDYDGDLLSYQWIDGSTNVLCSGNIQSVAEGTPVAVPECVASNLSLGLHTISLQADDGLNSPDSNSITVEVVDTSVPTLSPLSSHYIIWPPNHDMVDIVIEANASDNGGGPITLNATVTSNEPQDGLGDGDIGPDIVGPEIDQNTGRIDLQLRRERSGSGNGREYTITITATDDSNNSSEAVMVIAVPHDKGKR
jgi:hypothetical protein